MIYFIGLAIVLALFIDLFYLLAVRIFVFLVVMLLVIIAFTNKFAIPILSMWLNKKIIMDLKKYHAHRNYIYLPIEKKQFLKKKASQLTVIDRESLDRNRLSEAELEAVEELFKDTLAFEILARLKQLAKGDTKAVKKYFRVIEHDLWGLAIINLILLFVSVILVLNLVFILRSFYYPPGL
ncbi:hypothetical protein [Candidatus Albibeggiatoa sp. nov. BB20]|uniref:hypothetical protein n=1 Tax=Candidatus Albibeggiatoa sp. nov. BB20 TaxID=3162723 RepID=UPI0033657745